MSEPHPQRRAALAALLSFIFPGLGQAYDGQRQLAAILALPVLILIAFALGAVLIVDGALTNVLLSTTALTTLLVIDLALMGWRLLAIAQAGFPPRQVIRGAVPAGAARGSGSVRRGLSAREWRLGFVTVLLAITVLMHGWAGIVLTRLDNTLGNVFSGSGTAQQDGSDPDGAGVPINQPEYAWDGTERINFLLLGVDSGPGRDEALTDTILVVSVDPVAETAVMVSVPRDTALVPLPDTSVYPDALYPMKINELSTEARSNAAAWCPDLPESEAALCGIRTLERSIGTYLGIPIQYYAQVDLRGFAKLIDAVGGVTLCLPGQMVDDQYTGPGIDGRGIVLPAGCSRYDGALALAYARSRKGYIELPDGTREQQDDFKRSDRQQQVLLELRREIARADIIFELPAILEAIGETVTTDFPRAKAGDLASLVPLVTGTDIQRVVLGLPDYVTLSPEPLVNYYITPKREVVRDKMAELFGGLDQLEGWYLNGEPPPAG
jgi:polyisoprenyl-teichoic acid--peptidoglycan teichoic acid transferase